MQPIRRAPYDSPTEQPDAALLVITTDRMAPRYPLGSRYIARPVPPRRWRYAFGVHALQLHTNARRVGRITSYTDGLLTLVCDATKEEFYIPLTAIDFMYKLAWADYMPEEGEKPLRVLNQFRRFNREWL